jgi:hypothetical protein
MLRIRKILLMGFFGLWVSSVVAQSDCPTIVQNALNATDAACEGASRNQACYGNITLVAEPQDGVADFNFEQPGDIVDVVGVRALTLEPLDAASDVWGVALMRLQANLPETLPGQNVTFLMFGDVEIRNAVETNVDPITLEATATGNINVRSGPSTNDEPISQLADGEIVMADGRNPDSTWLRIQLPDGTPGWVSAELVTFTGDLSLLNVVDPLALPPPLLTPMQAFYFQSGIGDAPCDEAPDSGVLIQTPEGVGQINFTVNEVDIQLGSTAYLQAQASGDMTVNVVENQATVSAQGTTRFVPAGSRVRVPLDANLVAAGPPSEPEPYNGADLAALPVGHMPREVEVAAALTQAELDALSANTLPVSGEWFYDSPSASLSGGCDPSVPDDPPRSRVITLNITDEFSAEILLQALGAEPLDNVVYDNPETNFYTVDWSTQVDVFHLEVRFTSPTQAEGITSLTWDDIGGRCTFTTTFTLEAQ